MFTKKKYLDWVATQCKLAMLFLIQCSLMRYSPYLMTCGSWPPTKDKYLDWVATQDKNLAWVATQCKPAMLFLINVIVYSLMRYSPSPYDLW